MDRISALDAESLLENTALVPAIGGSIPEMKKLRDRCLEAGFPALIGCPPNQGKG